MLIRKKITNIERALKDFSNDISVLKENKVLLWSDMLISRVLYGSKPDDYLFFEFYNLNNKERQKFLTHAKLKRLNKKLNSLNTSSIFGEKHIFNKNFKDFINRKWLYIPDSSITELETFINKYDNIIVKPIGMSQGKGIFKSTKLDIINNIESFYANGLKYKYIIEEVVIQSDYLARLNPDSLNTIRVNTLIKENEVIVIGASLRMGRGKVAVDNLAGGGVAAAIDIKTGCITTPARDKKSNKYDFHPTTEVQINGFKFKNWDKIIEFAKKAALIYPESKYIGWDIGVTDNGLELIEGNYYSCWQLLQIDQVGRYPLFK